MESNQPQQPSRNFSSSEMLPIVNDLSKKVSLDMSLDQRPAQSARTAGHASLGRFLEADFFS